jgi:hypothetical protein
MQRSRDADLILAIERTKWALGRPLRYGEREWGDTLGRSLRTLAEALSRHAMRFDSPSGVFERITNPRQLPFSSSVQQVCNLRKEHATLLNRVASLYEDLMTALQAFPASYNATADVGLDPQMVRAFRLLGVAAQKVEHVLDAVERHLREETGVVIEVSETSVI